MFTEKAESFIKYHFDQGINDRNALTKIYNVGYKLNYCYGMDSKEIMMVWKTLGSCTHVKNFDSKLVDCGYVREMDYGLEELCMRNYLAEISKYFKLVNAFAVIVANGSLCLNSVHVIPTKNLILIETSNERYTQNLNNRNFIDCKGIYELICKVHFECKYKVSRFNLFINFTECNPIVIRANNENFEILDNFVGNIIDYAQTCDEPINFMISFIMCYYERHHQIFNCSSVLITCNVSFDIIELFRKLCILLNKCCDFVKCDHNTIDFLYYSFLYRLPQSAPVRIAKDSMLAEAFKYCCLCDRTRTCQPIFNPGVIDISNYNQYNHNIMGLNLDNFDFSLEGSYGDELVDNLTFSQFQKKTITDSI